MTLPPCFSIRSLKWFLDSDRVPVITHVVLLKGRFFVFSCEDRRGILKHVFFELEDLRGSISMFEDSRGTSTNVIESEGLNDI